MEESNFSQLPVPEFPARASTARATGLLRQVDEAVLDGAGGGVHAHHFV